MQLQVRCHHGPGFHVHQCKQQCATLLTKYTFICQWVSLGAAASLRKSLHQVTLQKQLKLV